MGSKEGLLRSVLLGLGLSLAFGTGVAVAAEGKATADTKAPAGKPADKRASESRTAVPNLTAAEIVDKHVLARGGLQAWRGVQALAVSGRLEAGSGDSYARSMRAARAGRGSDLRKAQAEATAVEKAQSDKQVELPFRLEMKRPNKSRVEIEFAGKTAVQVYDGKNGWKLRPFLNRNDVEPFTAEEAKSEAQKPPLDGPLIDYAAKGTKVELEKIEPVEGHQAYKLKLTMKDGTLQHVWIDAQSFLDVKIDGAPRRFDGRMRDVWIYQRDFRPVQGLMVPFVLETAVDGVRQTHTMTVEKVAVNPNLDDTRFAKPGV
jgi:outer membrane lipoprotein-sorting protein